MAAKWNVLMIVENRPGAGTNAGTVEVARSPGDAATISARTINPAIRKKLPYDTLHDLRGVTELGEAHVVLVANRGGRSRELPESGACFHRAFGHASSGTGTSTHLASELMQRVAGIKMLQVPYDDSAPALTDVLAGCVPLMFDI